MQTLTVDQKLPDYCVRAKNFASDSDNKIHSDETAAQYGFNGGLVPGVGTFGYMTRPVAELLGREWLERGSMTAKFIKPVYENDLITIESQVVSTDPLRIVLSVLNAEGTLCAVGEASLPDSHGTIDIEAYPLHPIPDPAQKFAPTVEALAVGTQLGSVCFPIDLEEIGRGVLDDLDDSLELYRGADPICHPAFVVFQANALMMDSIDLGPWIHTASNVAYHGLPREGEIVCLRAKVRNSYVKNGHEIAVLDMALIGEEDRPLAHLTHTAIVQPKLNE